MVLALPALPAIIVGLAWLFLIWAAAILLVKPLAMVFEHIPVVGKAIYDGLMWLGEMVTNFVRTLVDGAVQVVVDAVDWIVGSVTAGVRWLAEAAAWLGFQLKIIIGNLWNHIMAAEKMIETAVSNGLTALSKIAQQAAQLAALGATVAWVLATRIPNAIANAIAQAAHTAANLVAAAKSLLIAAINAALATALRAVGNEAAARAAQDAAVKAFAAATAVLVGQKAAQDLAGLEAWTGQQVGQLGQAIDNIGAKIGPIAYPTVAVALTAITATITQLTRTCVTPTCNYLGPQLAALELAMDATMLLAVAGWVAQAANDPRGAAQETVATASPILGMVGGLFADMTGQPIRA